LILHFPDVHSLKEKRQLLSSLTARIRERYPVSIAETGYQDLWQRAVVEVVMISSDPRLPERIFEKIREMVLSSPELVLLDSHREFL
jgi:uncharacterized protein YlxP (DUF503 family)